MKFGKKILNAAAATPPEWHDAFVDYKALTYLLSFLPPESG